MGKTTKTQWGLNLHKRFWPLQSQSRERLPQATAPSPSRSPTVKQSTLKGLRCCTKVVRLWRGLDGFQVGTRISSQTYVVFYAFGHYFNNLQKLKCFLKIPRAESDWNLHRKNPPGKKKREHKYVFLSKDCIKHHVFFSPGMHISMKSDSLAWLIYTTAESAEQGTLLPAVSNAVSPSHGKGFLGRNQGPETWEAWEGGFGLNLD